jgi:ubiquinone biosynthesis protein
MINHRINPITRTYRHISRYSDIISVLVKYGFGNILAKLDLQKHLDFGKSFFFGEGAKEIATASQWERARMAMEELGPTFVKFGQIMSTRPDMIPPELIQELEKLQDKVPPFSTGDAKRIIEEELGASVEVVFAEFSDTPIAAASMAQVYKAVLPEGETVAVKVQRPDIDKIIEVDLEIMHHLATLIKKHYKELGALDPVAMVEEFARVIRKELDFRIEAAHITRFATNFQSETTIHVPKVYKGLSSSKVLTMEFIGGFKVTESRTREVQERGIDPKLVAARGTDFVLKQVFEHGFFHADPHPGNIRVLDGNIICFLDYGMMGTLSAQRREDLADILIGIVTKDERKITRTILKISKRSEAVDEEALESDVYELMGVYAFGSLKELELGSLLNQIANLITEHQLKGPRDFYLLAKALITIEGVGRDLDPDFNAVEHAEPFAEKLIMDRTSPQKIIKDLYSSVAETRTLLHDLPYTLNEMLRQMKHGETKVKFEHTGIEPVLKTLDTITNRIAFAIVLASLVIGSALISLSDIPHKWHDIPVTAISFFIAGIIGLWLLISILRRGNL